MGHLDRLRSTGLDAAERTVVVVERGVIRAARSLHLSISVSRLRRDKELFEWADKVRAAPPKGATREQLVERLHQELLKGSPEDTAAREAGYRASREAWRRQSQDPVFMAWLREQEARLAARTAGQRP